MNLQLFESKKFNNGDKQVAGQIQPVDAGLPTLVREQYFPYLFLKYSLHVYGFQFSISGP